MRRMIATGLAALLLVAGAAPAAKAGDRYAPQPTSFRSGDVTLKVPATPGFCAPEGDYTSGAERMNGLARYALLLFSCEQMAAHETPYPMFMIMDVSDPSMVVPSREALFKILEGYPESAWNESIQAGAAEVTAKSGAKGITPRDTTMNFGFTKRGHDDAGFYLAGVVLVQGGGREGRGSAAMAVTQLRGRTLVLMILGMGDTEADVDSCLARLKAATRAILMENGGI